MIIWKQVAGAGGGSGAAGIVIRGSLMEEEIRENFLGSTQTSRDQLF